MKPQIKIKDAIGMTLEGAVIVDDEKLMLSFTDGFCFFKARDRVDWIAIEETSKPVDLLELSAIAVTLGIATEQEIAQLKQDKEDEAKRQRDEEKALEEEKERRLFLALKAKYEG